LNKNFSEGTITASGANPGVIFFVGALQANKKSIHENNIKPVQALYFFMQLINIKVIMMFNDIYFS
jgi:hypothetical protein